MKKQIIGIIITVLVELLVPQGPQSPLEIIFEEVLHG
jgi:hypothetical protein